MLSCQANTPYFSEENKKDGIADEAFLNEYDVWINGVKDSIYLDGTCFHGIGTICSYSSLSGNRPTEGGSGY